MRRETKEKWRDRVLAWQRSGLSCPEFARSKGLNSSTLEWWKWNLNADPFDEPEESLHFVELNADSFCETKPTDFAPPTQASTSVAIQLHLGPHSLSVPEGFNSTTLNRLLDTLEARK